VLQEIEVRAAGLVQCDNLAVNDRVVGKISQSFNDERILSVKEFRRLERRFSLPDDFTAMKRYSSSLISYSHCGPSGSFGTAKHSIGSLHVAAPSGREFSIRSMSEGVMRKIKMAGDGMAAACSAEGNLSLARSS